MNRRNPKEIVSQTCSAEVQLAKANASAAHWKAQHKTAIDTAVSLEKQLDVITAIESDIPTRKFYRAMRGKPEGVAVIVPATDWHVEEKVSSDATGGKNEFNLVEADRRIRRFYQKVLELIAWQESLAPVSQLWHPLLGDLMSGYIHEELLESNACSPTEACVFLQDEICAGIDLWLRETSFPIIIPTCVGNHGRTTQKKRIKTSVKNSFEWLIYTTLAKRYTNNGRVFWQIGRGYHNVQIIMGRRVRFHHGDAIRYFGGVGGISIPVNKAVSQWDRVEPADFDIFGHFHQFLSHYPKWIACGSLMGYNEFSVAIKAEFQHPTQTFIVIDRKYGLTQATPIFLTKPQRVK